MTCIFPKTLMLLIPILMGVFAMFPHSAYSANLIMGIQAENEMQMPPSEMKEDAFKRMEATGVKMVRVSLLWYEVAGSCTLGISNLNSHLDPCYNWSKYDSLVTLADKHGISVMFSVVTAPGWANGNQSHYSTGVTEDQFVIFKESYASFARSAVMRYPTVKHWTIWNEPNGGLFFQPMSAQAPKRYAQMYVRAAMRMKAVNPSVLIAIGPIAPTAAGGIKPVKYIPALQRELELLNAKKLVDAIAHNPYPTAPHPPMWFRPGGDNLGSGKINKLIAILDKSSITRNKPIWATEFAYETKPDVLGVTLERQSRYMADLYRMLWQSNRVTIGIWYVLTDPSDPKDWQSGLYHSPTKPKPSASMYKYPISTWVVKKDRYVWGMSQIDKKIVVSFSKDRKRWQRLKNQKIIRKAVVVKIPRTTHGYVRVCGPKTCGVVIKI